MAHLARPRLLVPLALALAAALAPSVHAAPPFSPPPLALQARTTETQPLALMLDAGFGGPTGIFGASVGYHFNADWELAAGFGLGVTGYQAALMGRYALPLGDSGMHSLVFGLGPSLGFRSEALGMHIEHSDGTTIARDRLYFTLWLNAEIGWEARFRLGLVVRIVAGAELRVADNQAGLCDGASTSDGTLGGDCNPRHLPPGSEIASHLVLPYAQFSFGWSF